MYIALIFIMALMPYCVFPQCQKFRKGIITLQTDDGFISQMRLLDLLKERHLQTTYYINSDEKRLTNSRYMSRINLRSLKHSYLGNIQYENHTKSHARLTEICNPSDYSTMNEQIDHTDIFIRQNLFTPNKYKTHLAAPFGAINDCVRDYAINKSSLLSLRGVQRGLNYRDGDKWNMKAYSVDVRRPLSVYFELVDQVIAEKGWLQLYWHLMEDNCGSEIYCFTTQDTIQLLDYIKLKQTQSSVSVVHLNFGVNRMTTTVNSLWNQVGSNECVLSTNKRKLLQTEIEQQLNEDADDYCYLTVADEYERCEYYSCELCLQRDQPIMMLDGSPCNNMQLIPNETIVKYKCHTSDNPQDFFTNKTEPPCCW